MSRFIDFDAARAERTKEPITLRAYGVDIELPGTIPASLMLDIVDLEERKGSDEPVTVKESLKMIRRVLPQEVLDGLLARDDFDMDDFAELTGLIVQTYMGVEPGNSPAPNRAARRHPAKSAQRGSQSGLTPPKANAPTPDPGETS